jgi:tetratricopeptide (TPR) repeat protein
MRRVLGALALAAGLTANAAAQTAYGGGSAAIPITTTSEEARARYLEGRDLFETLHVAESHPKFDAAVEADPDFALAWLGRAQSAPTAAIFFESLERAVELAPRVSEGERLQILAFQAAVNSDPDRQLELLNALVEAHPDDERAHNQLGNFYNGRQEYERAIEHYKRAIELNPRFTGAYNILGYAYRFLDRYDDAERTFQEYIEVLPNEPNPYDSYAELLMRMGRFEESIAQYRKAMEVDPEFTPSLIGIGNNQMFMGRNADARRTFEEYYAQAPNDGVRRNALFWTAASYVHEGKRDEAIETVRKMMAIAEKTGDLANVSGDHLLIGNILLETGGSPDEALASFEKAVEVSDRADQPEEVKEAARRNHLYQEALVALAKDDLATAKAKADAYREAVDVEKVRFEVQQTHELAGRIALAEGDVAGGIAELEKANQLDPRVLWALSRAHERAGHADEARAWAKRAADFNQLNFALGYVRNDARNAAGGAAT